MSHLIVVSILEVAGMQTKGKYVDNCGHLVRQLLTPPAHVTQHSESSLRNRCLWPSTSPKSLMQRIPQNTSDFVLESWWGSSVSSTTTSVGQEAMLRFQCGAVKLSIMTGNTTTHYKHSEWIYEMILLYIKTPWMKGNFQYRISQKAFLSVITHHSNLSRLPNTTKQQNPSNNLSSWANQGPTAKPGCSCQAPQGHSKSFEMKTAVAWMVGSFDSKLSFKIIIIFYISSFGMPTFLGTFEVLPLESVKGAQLQLWNQIDYRDI